MKTKQEAPFADLPEGIDIARYFWHEVVLVDRDGPHRLGNYHGCDGINLWRDGADYCYLWVEAVVDQDMYVNYLLDIRTNVRGDQTKEFTETRDFLFVHAGADNTFECSWQNKPINFDASTSKHIDHLHEGLQWFTDRVIDATERHAGPEGYED